MRGRKVRKWEKKLKGVFDTIDHELEAQYKGTYTLHPARPRHGTTSNPEFDGLFNVGAAFSAGFGSKYGPGYVVEIRLSTLKSVPAEVRKKIKAQVFEMLDEKLPEAFPGKNLDVADDNGIIRIHGDLSLDE